MVKINLLDSVTERQKSVTTTVEKKVTSSSSKLVFILLAVFGLLVVVAGSDYFMSTSAKNKAQKELEEQKLLEKQLEAVIKEQNELQQKIKDVENRIDAIKNLRSNQTGPVAVLRSLTERINDSPGLYLASVEQKGSELIIRGNSPNEYTVQRFGSSLEFSNGLFSNLNIETKRVDMEFVDQNGQKVSLNTDPNAPKPETVSFTIKCGYSPANASKPPETPSSNVNKTAGTQSTNNQVAQK